MAPNGPSASSATSSFEGQAGLSTAFGGSSAQAAAQMAQLMGSSPPLAPPIVEVPGPLFRANSQQHAPPRRLPSGLSAQAGAPVPSLPMPAGSFLMPGAAMAMPPPALRATSCKGAPFHSRALRKCWELSNLHVVWARAPMGQQQ